MKHRLGILFRLWIVFSFSYCSWAQAIEQEARKTLPLFYWHTKTIENFGDYLSLKLVERITGVPIRVFEKNPKKGVQQEIKFLAIGSILTFATNNDVIWGSGINGKSLDKIKYAFNDLDIRSVRGPLTRQFLLENFGIEAPEIYGDPGLLVPFFFPELKKKENPQYEYIVIPHYTELGLFPKQLYGDHIVYPTEPWDTVIKKILDSKFVISSSLHGIIIAEAYGIPARMLRVTLNEPLFKYYDYYYGTNRAHFVFATSVEEALRMGGELPFKADLEYLERLYQAFPFDLWPGSIQKPLIRD